MQQTPSALQQQKVSHMRNTASTWLLAGMAAFICGCATFEQKPMWSSHCPKPEHDQGYLVLEKGKTRKCHIQAYSRTCRAITDSTGADGLVCGYAQGSALYLFDKQGFLQNHKIFQRQGRTRQ